MNDRTQSQPTRTAVATTESARTRRVLWIAWFVFLTLGAATILASRAVAQAPAGARPATTKAPAATTKSPAASAKAPAAGTKAPAATTRTPAAGAKAPAAGAKAAAAKPKPAVRPAAPMVAKKYDIIPLNAQLIEPQTLQRMERAAKALVTARELASFTELKYAEVYYMQYVPAKITQPDALAEISPLIQGALDNYARAQRSKNPGAREMLRWLVMGMKPVAEGNYQPAARINATLVLGKLDVSPAEGTRPPVPLKYCYPILLKLYEDANNSDGVRAAALQGLHRSVSYGFPQLTEDDRKPLIADMKKLLTDPTPAGRSPKAHAFMQRYAVDILDLLATANDNTLATQLVNLSTNTDQPNLIALYSAARLGSMNGLQAAVPAPAKVLNSWSLRALQAFEAELARLKALDRPAPAQDQPPDPETQIQKKAVASSGMGEMGDYESQMGGGMEGYEAEMGSGMEGYDMDMGMGMGGYGMGMMVPEANPQPHEVIISRRNLNFVLEQLQRGVTGGAAPGVPQTPGGLLAAAGGADKEIIDAWAMTISEVVTSLNDKMLDDRKKYVEGLELQIVMLKDLAGVAQEPGAVVEAGPAAMMPIIPGMDPGVPGPPVQPGT